MVWEKNMELTPSCSSIFDIYCILNNTLLYSRHYAPEPVAGNDAPAVARQFVGEGLRVTGAAQSGRAQIGTGRFVDQLGGDRLALADLPALTVDGHDHLIVERLDRQRRQVFRARSARVARLAFLESSVHRRLAAPDLVIALF